MTESLDEEPTEAAELDHLLEVAETSIRRALEVARAVRRRERRAAALTDHRRVRRDGATVAEIARALTMTEERVRRLLRSGELQGVSFGGRIGWRVDRAYLARVAARWHRYGVLSDDLEL